MSSERHLKVLNLVVLLTILSTSFSLTINCRYNEWDWNFHQNVYECQGTHVHHEDTLPYLSNITGLHMSGGNHTEVEAMRVMHQQSLTFIPTGIEKFFPNLKGLSFLNCNVRSVTKDHLMEFPEMLQLSYNLNQIEVLPGDLFIYTPKLKLVNFAGNIIKHIGVGLLKPVPQLDYIWLEKNVCIDMNSKRAQFKKLNKEIRKNCRMGGRSDCKKIPLAFRVEQKTVKDTCDVVHVYVFKEKPRHELIRLQREKEEKDAKDREHYVDNILRVCEADSPLLRYMQKMLNLPGKESLPQYEPPPFDFVKLEKETRKKNWKKARKMEKK